MDEYIAHLNRKLEVMKLCVSLSMASTEDAHFVMDAQAKLVDACEHRWRIDELCKQYEQVKERQAKVLAGLEVQMQLAECQKSFLYSLPPKSRASGMAAKDSFLAASDEASRL
ncbi:hypothetical protein MRX96_031564 [Rhipicephalus microplus]